MKATGIVRRIDELGRVVIPKEIRKTLRIKEGDPLEIFTDKDELTFRKYSPVASLDSFAEDICESLNSVNECTAVICDRENVICAKGFGSKELKGKKISRRIEALIDERKSVVINKTEGAESVAIADDGEGLFPCQVIVPIVSSGDALGAVILAKKEENAVAGNGEIKSVRLVSDYIGRFLS